MVQASTAIREFFDAYAKATDGLDLMFLGTAYGAAFMFASPGGVQVVSRDDFLKVVPKRAAFMRSAGLMASEVSRLDELRLDEKHVLVQTHWTMRFEKEPGRTLTEEIGATYIVRCEEQSMQIIVQIDHQDLAKRLQEMGRASASS